MLFRSLFTALIMSIHCVFQCFEILSFIHSFAYFISHTFSKSTNNCPFNWLISNHHTLLSAYTTLDTSKILRMISIMSSWVFLSNPGTRASKFCGEHILWHCWTIKSIIPEVKSQSRNGIDPKFIWSRRSFNAYSRSFRCWALTVFVRLSVK